MRHDQVISPPSIWSRIGRFVIRNRVSLQDLLLVGLTVGAAAFVCLEIDVFVVGDAHLGRTIETDELPLIGAVLVLALLLFTWRRFADLKNEVRRRREAEQSIRELAFRDPLTGLANRRQFGDTLRAALLSPPRSGGAHALLMLDLNGFKQVNDVHGHGAGDELLMIVSKRLLGAARENDLVARLGGDEFAILAQHLAGPEAATGLALRVLDAIAEPIAIGSVRHDVSTGIGICPFPFPDATTEEIIRRADVALYRAKAERTSALRFFDEDMDRLVRERDRLERDLRLAIESGDVRPYFQPLVDLATKDIVGFEALARWEHPEMGEIPPDRFIPIAEDAGLMMALTETLLDASCRAALLWPPHVTLSFNISPSQLREPALALKILAILARTGLPARRLEIEITESALVGDMEAAQRILGSLRDAGVRIALDDFGTGYSSLYHLRNFKLDKIKIDRSFVGNMGTERESSEIVTALIGLGRGLGLTVTAEGVEGTEEEESLLARGCQQGQGYLFSGAVPAAEAAGLFGPDKAAARA